jgi:hypothetical protein
MATMRVFLGLDRLPTSAEADAIRDVIGIRKRRHMTAELAKLERARKAIKSPVSASPIRFSERAVLGVMAGT